MSLGTTSSESKRHVRTASRTASRAASRAAALCGALGLTLAVGAPQAHAAPPGNTTSILRNVASNWCADLPDYGPTQNSYVYEYPCNSSSGDNMLWTFTYTGNTVRVPGPNGTIERYTFLLRNTKSGQCMDLPDTGAAPAGTRVWMHSCTAGSGDNQEWVRWYGPGDDSSHPYYLNVRSGLCLDVDGWGGPQNGLPLTVFYCYGSGYPNNGSDDHLWSTY